MLIILVWLFYTPLYAFANSAGSIRYNDTLNNYEFYNGATWYQFSAITIPLSSCTQKAEMNYDALLASYNICDGSQIKRTVGTLTLAFCSTSGSIDYRSNTLMYCNGLLWVDLKGLPS